MITENSCIWVAQKFRSGKNTQDSMCQEVCIYLTFILSNCRRTQPKSSLVLALQLTSASKGGRAEGLWRCSSKWGQVKHEICKQRCDLWREAHNRRMINIGTVGDGGQVC